MFLPVQHDPNRSARIPGSSQGIYLCSYLSSIILTSLPDFLAATAQAAAKVSIYLTMFLFVQHDSDRSARFLGSCSIVSSQSIYLCSYLSSMILTGLPDLLAAAAQAAVRGSIYVYTCPA